LALLHQLEQRVELHQLAEFALLHQLAEFASQELRTGVLIGSKQSVYLDLLAVPPRLAQLHQLVVLHQQVKLEEFHY